MMCLFRVVFCLFLLSTTIDAQETTSLDSLTQRLVLEKDPCQQSFLLTMMADLSKPLNLENAIVYAKRGLKLAIPNDCANLGDLYGMLGYFHEKKGKFDIALSYLEAGLLVYKEKKDTVGLIKNYGYIANIHFTLADYAKATTYAYIGMDLNKGRDNKGGDAQLLVILATISIEQEEYEKALVYIKKALKIAEEENFSTENKATLCYNMGGAYTKLEQLDSAFTFYQKALLRYREGGNVYGVVLVHLELAIAYRNQGEREEALKMIREIEALRGYIPTRIETNATIDCVHGSIYQVNKEYDKAIPLLNRALEQAQELKTKAIELSVINRLIDCYESKNDLAQALSFQKQAGALKDSIFNVTKQRQIKNLEIKYETAKKEQENSLLKEQKKSEELKVETSKQVILGISVLLLLVLIISYLLIKNNREKATRKNSQLKNQLLRNQMSPHFIFNSLMAIQSFMYKNDLRESSRYLSSFAKLMRAILENSRKEYISLDQELQWLENYMNLQLLRFNNKFEYTIDLDEELDIYSMLIPPMLTQPFIENAIEHGFKNIAYKGKLIVRMKLKEDSLQIEVEDNGIGINNAKQKEEKKEHKSLATIITQERLGYLNKNQSEKIYFDLKAIEPNGTVVRFSIPLKN